MPKVSIIMGVYNGAHRIDKSIQSIINQTFKDWEFVICDDGSSDGSFDKIKQYTKKDDRIVAIKNPHNAGLAQTLNNCLRVAKGQYVARMDDDDYAYPDRLEKEVSFLDMHPEYDIVAGGRNMVDENGVWGKDDYTGERTKLDIYRGITFAHPTVMVRKEAYDRVCGYSTYEGIGREEDTDLWCKMYIAGSKGFILSDIMLDYFESRNSMTRRKYKFRISEAKIKFKYRKALGVSALYIPLAMKPLIVGLLPNAVIKLYHKLKFKK